MNFVLKTKVKGNYKEVMRRFDRKLFEALAPPFPKIELVEFTGSKKGDKVHIKFLSPVNSEWISDITEHGSNETEAWFVDEGTTLPFPLKFWRHRHIVRSFDESHSEIIDDITYEGVNGLISLLMFPALYFGFLQRKPIYKRYFKC